MAHPSKVRYCIARLWRTPSRCAIANPSTQLAIPSPLPRLPPHARSLSSPLVLPHRATIHPLPSRRRTPPPPSPLTIRPRSVAGRRSTPPGRPPPPSASTTPDPRPRHPPLPPRRRRSRPRPPGPGSRRGMTSTASGTPASTSPSAAVGRKVGRLPRPLPVSVIPSSIDNPVDCFRIDCFLRGLF